jgi:hypothetical protein
MPKEPQCLWDKKHIYARDLAPHLKQKKTNWFSVTEWTAGPAIAGGLEPAAFPIVPGAFLTG